MPNDIKSITEPSWLPLKSKRRVIERIEAYFKLINGDEDDTDDSHHPTALNKKNEKQPPTLTGLALFLGFNSLHELNAYEQNGKYAALVKRAHLRIEAVYEQKLHTPSATGAMFALKNVGWKDGSGSDTVTEMITSFEMLIVASETLPAASEKEVVS